MRTYWRTITQSGTVQINGRTYGAPGLTYGLSEYDGRLNGLRFGFHVAHPPNRPSWAWLARWPGRRDDEWGPGDWQRWRKSVNGFVIWDEVPT